MDCQSAYESVVKEFREIALLETTRALLEWDERTGLPSEARGYRAEQYTLLSGLIHRRRTDPRLGDRLRALQASDLAADPLSDVGANVAKLLKDYERNVRLPNDLVEAISKVTVLGQQAWERARAADDWPTFRPHLQEVFALRRREAECLCDGGPLYDALLDQYEEGARGDELTALFTPLGETLARLIKQLADAPNPPDGASWRRPIAIDQQRRAGHWIAERIGYRFTRGRLDETSHPFCTTLGPDDCRILTRYDRDYFPSAFYSTLHEAGHGLYEQGLPRDAFGLPLGAAASLGVHESQSRLWENFVGRDAAFWRWGLPEMRSLVDGWGDLDATALYRDANRVQPSLIRVEADEATYNLHILIRFELERALLDGELPVDDAPGAWNERYEHYLGIRPSSDRDGILQDVHWSAGLIGYFPTYTLGNLYAAQLMVAMRRDLGEISPLLERGEFTPLLEWLRSAIHAHGRRYAPAVLVERAAGEALDATPLIDYLTRKLTAVYGIGD